jgi:hypothetical protein
MRKIGPISTTDVYPLVDVCVSGEGEGGGGGGGFGHVYRGIICLSTQRMHSQNDSENKICLTGCHGYLCVVAVLISDVVSLLLH